MNATEVPSIKGEAGIIFDRDKSIAHIIKLFVKIFFDYACPQPKASEFINALTENVENTLNECYDFYKKDAPDSNSPLDGPDIVLIVLASLIGASYLCGFVFRFFYNNSLKNHDQPDTSLPQEDITSPLIKACRKQ